MMTNTKTKLRDGTVHDRIINGCWQFSEGHSENVEDPITSIQKYINEGFHSFDGADIYTGVEEIFGNIFKNNDPSQVRFHTKHVPDLIDVQNGNITAKKTRSQILRSLTRLGIQKLHNVQFHWWDYGKPGYEISIQELKNLQTEGKIEQIGITNSNIEFLKILEQKCDFTPISTQNQFSVIDRRAETYLIPYCQEKEIALYCYGSLMGGLLSERYYKVSKPQEPLENRSLRKYLKVLDDWGNWELFQELLEILYFIGQKYDATISEISMAWVLQKKGVSSIIVGMRNSQHIPSLKKVYSLELDTGDLKKIELIYHKGKALEGDVFDLERDEPRHRDIMKFNLNKNSQN